MQKQQAIELKTNSFDLFNDSEICINIKRIFFAYHQIIPNVKSILHVDNLKFRKHLESNFSKEIIHKHYNEVYKREMKKMMYSDLLFFMEDGTLLYLCNQYVGAAFANGNDQAAQKWIDIGISFYKNENKKTNEICLMVTSEEGITTTAIKLKKPKLDLKTNYNDDIIDMHKTVVEKLRKKNTSGLFLFYGSPGTGKSTYIKFLIHHLNKNVIFMSPRIASNLDAPELMNFLLLRKNSVIVIEDAEELVATRDTDRNSAISTILNLTDGLLGECLHIHIIATFNTQLRNIDKALLRKGRLQGMYEFKDLTITKAQELSYSLGYDNAITQPMSLANIYYQSEQEYNFNKKTEIGFRTN